MSKKELIAALLKHRYAHRGLHEKPVIPENSMAAFRRAVIEGFGIELDVHLTKDNKLAIIHDSSLKRTCGVDLQIEDLTLEEAQIYFLEKSQERIPSFEEVLEMVDGKVPLIVELKVGKNADGNDTTKTLCEKTMETLDQYQGTYCVESFSPLAVKWFRKNRPDVVRGQLAGHLNRSKKTLPWIQDYLLKHLIVNRVGKPDFVAYCFEDRQETAIQMYRGPVFYWTIREYADLKTVEALGGAAIFEKFNPKEYEKYQ